MTLLNIILALKKIMVSSFLWVTTGATATFNEITMKEVKVKTTAIIAEPTELDVRFTVSMLEPKRGWDIIVFLFDLVNKLA